MRWWKPSHRVETVGVVTSWGGGRPPYRIESHKHSTEKISLSIECVVGVAGRSRCYHNATIKGRAGCSQARQLVGSTREGKHMLRYVHNVCHLDFYWLNPDSQRRSVPFRSRDMSGQRNQLETVRQLLLLVGSIWVYTNWITEVSVSCIYRLSSLFLLPFHNLKKLEKYFLATESGHEPR